MGGRRREGGKHSSGIPKVVKPGEIGNNLAILHNKILYCNKKVQRGERTITEGEGAESTKVKVREARSSDSPHQPSPFEIETVSKNEEKCQPTRRNDFPVINQGDAMMMISCRL